MYLIGRASSSSAVFNGNLIIAVFCLVGSFCLSALAEDNTNNWQRVPNDSLDKLNSSGRPVTTIIPIFSQLVAINFPDGFKSVSEKTTPPFSYTWEAVLKGETIRQWSQMITITGGKGLVSNPTLNPQLFLARIAGGFKTACPNSFSAKGVGAEKISGYDAFVALTGCGSVQYDGNPHSEAALLIGIKGSNDYYTVQWAERGLSQDKPIDLNDPKWPDRFKKLNPIKVCTPVPGEAAPYPSCLGQK